MTGGLAGVGGGRGGLVGKDSGGTVSLAALSVFGNATGLTADAAAITAAANNTFLGRQSDTLAFSALVVGNITNTSAGRIPYSDGTTLVTSAELTYVTATATLDVAKSLSGSTGVSSTRNTSNTASSGARVLAEVAGSSGGDPQLQLSVAGNRNWYVLCSNGTSDEFQIREDTANVYARCSTNGDWAFGPATDANHRIKGSKAGTNVSMAMFATGSQAFANVQAIANAGETEAAAMGAGANDATSTIMGVSRAAGAFFYGKSAIDNVVIGGTKSTSILSFAPGDSVKARIVGATGNLILGATSVTDVATTALRVHAARTVASAAGAVWDGVDVISSTLTITGNTGITTATGVNLVSLRAPTLSAASALTVDFASTLYIAGPPTGGGAGPADILSPLSLWVDTGRTRLDGSLNVHRIVPGQSSVASAATLDPASSATYFRVTGTTNISHIYASGTNREGGIIVLDFDGVLTVTHNAATPPAGSAPVFLAGSVNLTTAARTRLFLIYDGAGDRWLELARTVA